MTIHAYVQECSLNVHVNFRMICITFNCIPESALLERLTIRQDFQYALRRFCAACREGIRAASMLDHSPANMLVKCLLSG